MALLEASPQQKQTTRQGATRAAKWLFGWRNESKFRGAEGFALSLFFCIAAYTLHFHEKWDDEAQAWLIARDNSVWQILVHRLHYEGAPPAWPLLMHAFHSLGGTYVGLGWLSVVLATAGVYVWLRWSPFPALLRFVFPFTFWMIYQYAVVARAYVLFPLLTFALCALYTRKDKLVWFALVAGLLANISMQGFVLAFAFGALYVFDEFRSRSTRYEGRSEVARFSRRKQRVGAGVLFAAMACTAIYCAIPAPDLDFAIGDQVSDGWVHRVLLTLIGETPRNAPKPAPEPKLVGPALIPPPAPHWNREPRAWLERLVYPIDPLDPPRNDYAIRWTVRTIGPVVLDFADDATWPISESNLLACAFLAAAGWWFYVHRRLRMLLLWVTLIASGKVLWIAEHHAGMLLIGIIAGAWLAVDTGGRQFAAAKVDQVFLALLTVVLLMQVGWSVYAIHSEVEQSYDPGPETALWLKEHPEPRMAAFGFPTVSIEPWFARPPFFNLPSSWWQWSANVEVDGIHQRILESHPDLVVYGLEFPGYGQMRDQWLPVNHISLDEERDLPHDPLVKDLHDHGYVETHRFCGTRFSRFSSSYRICHLIFQPATQ